MKLTNWLQCVLRVSERNSRRRSSRCTGMATEALEQRVLLTTLSGDFNGDGFDDLATGTPAFDVYASSTKTDAGRVWVQYGSSGGLSGSEWFDQSLSSVDTNPGTNENFGESLAIGDFDADGYDDLAIGIPGQDENGHDKSGAIYILYGGSFGLTTVNDQFFNQADLDLNPVSHDRFGQTLTSGDFDGDGKDDLAIGMPGYKSGAGMVVALYGSTDGLEVSHDHTWHQASKNVAGVREAGDGFGYALSSGDYDGDGRDDLAVGIPFEDHNSKGLTDAGAVHIIMGSSNGLTSVGDKTWHQDTSGINGAAESYDYFGISLASGDFDNDGRDDLAIGVTGEDVNSNTITNAGAVNVIMGSKNGLTSSGNKIYTQDTSGVKGKAEAYDNFGQTLVAADFNDDGRDDLAIGVPWEDVDSNTIDNAGAVNILLGSSSGLTTIGDQIITQQDSGIKSVAHDNEWFGWALTAGDYDGDGHADLAIGVPGEDVSGITDAGAVQVIFGNSGGLSTKDQFWTSDELVGGLLQSYMWFGNDV